MRESILAKTLLGFALMGSLVGAAFGQAVPKERNVVHREQTLKEYDPFSAEELFKRIKIPPAPALSPAEALESFKVAPGFRIECVAAEPLVVDPVMFEFDADGRIWAVEMRGWMRDVEGTGEADPICKIVVLEDTDGDSFMDRSTVFLDNLVMPRTLSFVEGGVLVAEPPNLWYCRDLDGDLKCDDKRLVGKYGRPGNPEHTDNGLMHALDNWMYNAKSSVRHKFVDGKLIEEPTVFRGQWGMTQDDYGRLFYNYQNSSLHSDLVPGVYIERNRHAAPSGEYPSSNSALNVNLATNAHEVFPIRVTPGITLGGTELREDGTLRTFTIACGLSIYRGDQFPAAYYGGAVIPESGGNLVRFDHLSGDGVHLAARNAFAQSELLASTDERFRPVSSRTGPDGALYICDLYRGIIEHVVFMMPYLRNQILSRGLDKPLGMGRIYRIVHEDKPLSTPPRMSAESSEQLVARLSHPNGWHRDTAQRLLVERKAIDTAEALRELATTGKSNLGRLHALWTLEGIGRLDWPTVSSAMSTEDARVRATAIRLSERLTEEPSEEQLFARLQSFFSDERPMVQLQLMLTLARFADLDEATTQMASILIAHTDNVFRAALVSGLEGRELEMLQRLIDSPSWTDKHEKKCRAIGTLAMCVVQEAEPERIERLFALAAGLVSKKGWVNNAIVTGVFTSNLSRSRWPEPIELTQRPSLLATLPKVSAERLARIVTWPDDTTVRERRPVAPPMTPAQQERLAMGEAIYSVTCFACHKANGRGQSGQAPSLVESEWVNGSPERLIRIALHGLRGPVKVNGEEWNLVMPGLGNSPILNDERMAGVLTYVRREWGNYGSAIDPELVAKIRESAPDRSQPWTVEELLNPSKALDSPASEKQDLLAPYRGLLNSGDAEKGRFLFHVNREIRCNACHKIGEHGGGFVGPDLTDVGKRSTVEHLLESLVDPSAKIAKGFETLVVITDDGKIVSGTVVSDEGQTLVIAQSDGTTAEISIDTIDERIQSPVSSMPPMGKAFTPHQIADLVAYLQTLKPNGNTTPNATDSDEKNSPAKEP